MVNTDYTYLYGQQAFENNAYLLGLMQDPNNPVRLILQMVMQTFSGLGTHPNGYNPWYEIQSQDLGVYAGIKGELDNGLTWDISGSIGQSRVDNNISDTHNPSLGGGQLSDWWWHRLC